MIDVYVTFSTIVACVWTGLGIVALYLMYRIMKALEKLGPTPVLYPSVFRNPSPHIHTTNSAEDVDTDAAELKRLNELLDVAKANESASRREQDQAVVEVHADNLCDEVDLSDGAAAISRKMSTMSDKKP